MAYDDVKYNQDKPNSELSIVTEQQPEVIVNVPQLNELLVPVFETIDVVNQSVNEQGVPPIKIPEQQDDETNSQSSSRPSSSIFSHDSPRSNLSLTKPKKLYVNDGFVPEAKSNDIEPNQIQNTDIPDVVNKSSDTPSENTIALKTEPSDSNESRDMPIGSNQPKGKYVSVIQTSTRM